MFKPACLAAVLLVLSGCGKPVVERIDVVRMEDQPKVVTAEVRPSGNMIYEASLEVTAVSPAQGAVPARPMTRLPASGGLPRYEDTLPMGSGIPAMPYGSEWTAKVSVPYTMLWQRQYASKSVSFVVGAAKGCFSFDGELGRQGWGGTAVFHSTVSTHPDKDTTVDWLAGENARPSPVKGALSFRVPKLEPRIGNESYSTKLSAGGFPQGWAGADKMQLALKASRDLYDIYAAILVNRGSAGGPGTEVLEWIYTNHTHVTAGAWDTLTLDIPPLPASVGNPPNSWMQGFTLNFERLGDSTQIVFDDVCPVH
jgi:hypothetical protein